MTKLTRKEIDLLSQWTHPMGLSLMRFGVGWGNPLTRFLLQVLRNVAVTWNGNVYLRPGSWASFPYEQRLWVLAHEAEHVQQQAEMGWGAFLRRYVRLMVRYASGGERHPMEAHPYQTQRVVRDALLAEPGLLPPEPYRSC